MEKILRQLSLMLLAACLSVTAARSAPASYRYDAENTVLTGRIKTELKRDAANRPEKVWMLHLARPITVQGTPGEPDSPTQKGVHKIHIAPTDEKLIPMLRRYVRSGQSARLTGSLFAWHTAHHHTPVMLSLRDIRPAAAPRR